LKERTTQTDGYQDSQNETAQPAWRPDEMAGDGFCRIEIESGKEIMKAISLWEPWATLIRAGAKRWETRSWSTNYRGRLLICASKRRVNSELHYFLSRPEFNDGVNKLPEGPKLYFGKAVAIVEVLDCISTNRPDIEQLVGDDLPFGDYSPNRFAWRLNLLRRDFSPFSVDGHQGLFDVDDAEINRILTA
jgi:hypothetical protein